jgi:hypothetical protein
MKLLTKKLEKKLPDLYTTETVPDEERKVPIKFFTPWGNWTWYVLEGRPELGEAGNLTGDWLFFGLVDVCKKEMGYFTLKELEAANGPFGLKIKWDLYWDPETTLANVKARSARPRTWKEGAEDKNTKDS